MWQDTIFSKVENVTTFFFYSKVISNVSLASLGSLPRCARLVASHFPDILYYNLEVLFEGEEAAITMQCCCHYVSFGYLGFWASGLLGIWAFGHLGIWAFGHLGVWESGLLGIWAFGHPGIWAFGHLGKLALFDRNMNFCWLSHFQ